ncbi:hypothetical protein PISL3812_04390 [Talaromyces islandicus]|uniref:Protein kinase domain-containing protein n=1 Tax=Talaromyces islandicus TaxID=28573 RepID=A0A0U1LVE4_TALIS|nr:hypothetical protein PISL3812_04390 [Talaromyces islandicus]
MSMIKYFDTPHIVRFGMTNDDPATSETQFWRNGVHFLIQVDHADVRGTDFEQKWIPLLNPEPMSARLERWGELCDLEISQSLALLQELAPNRPHWNTLYDYLHVDSYTLRLSGSPGQDVSPHVVQGPTSTCAYEMETVAWETFTFPGDLPVYDSRVIISLDHEQNLKSPPQKTRLPDGKVAFFLPCQVLVRQLVGSACIDENESHQSIASYLLIHSLQIPHDSSRASVPKVLGIVSDSGHSATNTQAEGEKQVAGILLEWIDGFYLLNAGSKENRHVAMGSETNQARWREQIMGIVRELHRRGVSALGLEISPFSVMIDRNDGHAWLTGFVDCKVSEDHNVSEPESESEAKQVRDVFDQWLRAEVEHWTSDSAEPARIDVLKRWWAIAEGSELTA